MSVHFYRKVVDVQRAEKKMFSHYLLLQKWRLQKTSLL